MWMVAKRSPSDVVRLGADHRVNRVGHASDRSLNLIHGEDGRRREFDHLPQRPCG